MAPAQLLASCGHCEAPYDLFFVENRQGGRDSEPLACPVCRADWEPNRQQFEKAIGGPFVVVRVEESNVVSMDTRLPNLDEGEEA